MEPLAGLVAAAVMGLAAIAASAFKRYSGKREAAADHAWQTAAAKLGIYYRKLYRSRSIEGTTEGFHIRIGSQIDAEQSPAQLLTTYSVALKGQLPRFTVVSTSSFMNPHDARLATGDPEFDKKIAIIRPVRSHSGGYFTDARRRLILDLFDQYRPVTLSSTRLEVGTTSSAVSAQELVERTRSLVRAARVLSVETDRRGMPIT